MKHLDRNYPAYTRSMMLWLLPVVLLLGIAVLVLVLGVEEPVSAAGIIIAIVSGLVLAAISIGGFLYQYRARRRVRDKVIFAGKYFAVRSDVGFVPTVLQWGQWFVELDPLLMITNTIVGKAKVGKVPYSFLTLRPPGQVKWKWGKFEGRARGLQKGIWCNIEWHPDIKISNSLALHELAHVILTFNNPGMSVREQHEIMKETRIERLLDKK